MGRNEVWVVELVLFAGHTRSDTLGRHTVKHPRTFEHWFGRHNGDSFPPCTSRPPRPLLLSANLVFFPRFCGTIARLPNTTETPLLAMLLPWLTSLFLFLSLQRG